jgi:clan AA aspartic protease
MGVFSVRIDVGDPNGERFETVDAIVDTGATRTTIPARLLRALGVYPYRTGSFRLADGRTRELGLGRTRVRVEGREELTQVAFGDDEMPCLLGAITLEELDLAVDPVNKRLVPTTALLLAT